MRRKLLWIEPELLFGEVENRSVSCYDCWAKIKMLDLTYKVLNGLGPAFMKDVYPHPQSHVLQWQLNHLGQL